MDSIGVLHQPFIVLHVIDCNDSTIDLEIVEVVHCQVRTTLILVGDEREPA